eukprot:scaffold4155_cov165-Amphora_coffeaeformis.AAC.15
MDSTQELQPMLDKEVSILREAIFALQGIDGEYLQFDWSTPNLHEQRLRLGRTFWEEEHHNIPPESLVHSKLGSGAADALGIIGEAGWLYSRIQDYINKIKESSDAGAIQRGLTTALVNEMNAYRTLLVDLESKTLVDTHHMRHLLVAMRDPIRRLHSIAMITDGLTKDTTGGPVLRALEEHSRHGDTRHVELMLSLLAASSRPWFEMLFYWVTQGLLPEKHEFFVAETPGVSNRDMWRNRYQIDSLHLPPTLILPADTIQKAFQVGKGINFIRQCLADGEYSLESLEQEARKCFVYQPSLVGGKNIMEQKFCDCLDRAAETVNQHILQSLREQHNLRRHLYCLKQFLLLGQGDFVTNLTESLHNEFENHKGIVGIYRHTLAALTEGALRSSNASSLPEDCLQRLQVELRLSSDDDVNYKFGPDKESENDTRTVWDIFQLEYAVPDPALAIIEPKLMEEYRALFFHLFGLRKIEYYLNFTWRQSAMLSHALQSVAQYSGIKVHSDPHYANAVVLLRRIAITRQAMTNFVVNLKSFLMLEVIEGGWKHLERKIEESDSLDALISAHEEFLVSICRQSLLRSHDDDNEISRAVKDLLELCNQFSLYQRDLFGRALKLADQAAEKRRLAVARETKGDWGFDEIENTQTEETTFFGLSDASKIQDLDILSGYFHQTVLNLLQALDRKLNGPVDEEVLSTPTGGDVDQRHQADCYTLDEDLKLLRFLRAQLDQNQFYGNDL